MKRILITGSRDWVDASVIEKELKNLFTLWGCEVTFISGHCPTGADAIGEKVAKEFGWTLELYPAQWAQYGKSAGFIRNKKMIESKADICLAFIRNGSRGASGTAKLAEVASIETLRFTEGI